MKQDHSVKKTVTERAAHQMLPTRSLQSHGLVRWECLHHVLHTFNQVEFKDKKSRSGKPLSAIVSGGDQLKKVYFIACSDPRLSLMTFNKFLGSPKFKGLKHSQMTY